MADHSENLRIEVETETTSGSVLKKTVLEALSPTPFGELDPQVFSDWYLHSCYPEIPFHDEKTILDFLVSEAPKVRGASCLLEMGCGPVISHALPFVPFVESFIMSDYLDSNLELMRQCISRGEQAHNWSLHTAFVLRAEGVSPSKQNIHQRENLLREKIRSLAIGDLLSKRPLRSPTQFPVVSCFYSTEQAASDEVEWLDAISNLSSLVLPGGQLFMACLRETTYYAIHDQSKNPVRIPIVPISERLAAKGLQKAGFSLSRSEIHSVDVGGLDEEGIDGIILISAKKSD